jgi:rare lipoprotein A
LRRSALAAFCAIALVAGCAPGGFLDRLFGGKPPPPPPPIHYVVGEPYRLGGMWRYPRIQFTDDETGLAAVDGAHAPFTTDGEPFDQTILAAGHPTLQLPSFARVTNLQNGLSVVVRVNDRGPERPTRLVSLTTRTAALLHAVDGTRVRLQVLEGPSRQLAAELGGDGPRLTLAAAAPVAVQAESLAPPPGARAAGTVRGGANLGANTATATQPTAPNLPLRLPEQVSQGPVSEGRLFVEAGGFSGIEYARLFAGRLQTLGAQVATSYDAPRDRAFFVRIGPFDTVPEVDAALDRALRAGVTDGRIVVAP